jgi:hypothetical protein
VTEASDQVSIRAELEDIVTYDMLEVGSLFGQSITGLQIQTNDNPAVNGGIILNKDQLIAYSPPDNVGGSAAQTFRIDAATGAVSIGEYLGKEEAAGVYLGQSDASTTYSTKVEAQGIELKATNAQSSATGAQGTADTAITRIDAGDIKITKSGAVAAINEGVDPGNTTTISGGTIKTNTIDAQAISTGTFRSGVVYAGTINATQINAGAISADRLTSTSLNASNLTSGTISAARISTTALDANNITSGTLTGRVVQTASGGQRIALDNNEDAILVYNGNGNLSGKIYGSSSGDTGLRAQSAGGSGYLALIDNLAIIRGDNAQINVRGSATRSSARVEINAPGLRVSSLAAPGTSNGVIQSVGINGVLYANIMTGTGTRAVNVDSVGRLQRSTSDIRLKNKIEVLPLGLNFIEKLNPKKYERKSEPGVIEYGLIAQEVLEALGTHDPSQVGGLIVKDKDEYLESKLPEGEIGPVLGIEYIQLIPILINSIKELKAKVDLLEKEQDK